MSKSSAKYENADAGRGAVVTRTGTWVVCERDLAQLGRVLSVHRSYRAAKLAAIRVSGEVETADLVARVQAGERYTAVVQALAGTAIRPAKVVLP